MKSIRIAIFLLAAGLSILSNHAKAQDVHSANHLLRTCTPADDIGYLACVRYISGYARGFGHANVLSASPLACMPAGIENGQIVEVVLKYIRSKPEKWHNNADAFIFLALVDAFPCPKK